MVAARTVRAVVVGRVDPTLLVAAGDRHPQVARDAQQRGAATLLPTQDHDRVAALADDVGAAADDLGVLALGVDVLARVGADEQVVLGRRVVGLLLQDLGHPGHASPRRRPGRGRRRAHRRSRRRRRGRPAPARSWPVDGATGSQAWRATLMTAALRVVALANGVNAGARRRGVPERSLRSEVDSPGRPCPAQPSERSLRSERGHQRRCTTSPTSMRCVTAHRSSTTSRPAASTSIAVPSRTSADRWTRTCWPSVARCAR